MRGSVLNQQQSKEKNRKMNRNYCYHMQVLMHKFASLPLQPRFEPSFYAFLDRHSYPSSHNHSVAISRAMAYQQSNIGVGSNVKDAAWHYKPQKQRSCEQDTT